jgi:hypothetical protein
MDPITIGGIIAGAGSLLGSGISAASGGNINRKNRKWQEKMYKWQLQDQRDNAKMQWQENRDYAQWSYDKFESPVAQRAAYKAAGVNPFVEGSVLQSMGATQGNASAPDSGSVPSGGPYQNNPGSAIQGGFQGLQGSAMQIVQAQNIQAQTELTNATRLKTLAETRSIENANSLFDFVRSAAESDALSKRFKAKIDQVNAEFAEIKAIQDSAERDARIVELWSREENNLAQAAKTDADRLTVETLRDGMKRLQDAQIETEGAKQDNLRSGASLARAQKETEDALRQGRIKLTDRQAREVLQNIGLAEARTLNEYEDLVRAMTNTKEASSLWGYVDKLSARLSREDGTASYGAADELRQKLIRALAKFEKEN